MPESAVEDTADASVYTGMKITGGDERAILRNQTAAASGLTLAFNDQGEVWRTGITGTAVWQTKMQGYLSPIFDNSSQTAIRAEPSKLFPFGSFNLKHVDTTDIAALPDARLRASILTHEWVEQYQQQALGTNLFSDAHAVAVSADEKVIGGTNRTDVSEDLGGGRTRIVVTYDNPLGGEIEFSYDIDENLIAVYNVSFTR